MQAHAPEANTVQAIENIKENAVGVCDGRKKRKEWETFLKKDSSWERTDEEYHCEMHYSKTMLHKRKCIQHHSSAIQETENEKGKSEFVHLGKTSHWRQSISKSVLLKRAWWKYSSSQHKRSWHTFRSIGFSKCAGKCLVKRICLKFRNFERWRCWGALWYLAISIKKCSIFLINSDRLVSHLTYLAVLYSFQVTCSLE